MKVALEFEALFNQMFNTVYRKVRFGQYNVDECQDTLFKINSFPTIIVFRDGAEIDRLEGPGAHEQGIRTYV
jgi:thioredoxin-like negative regulator of GroEL